MATKQLSDGNPDGTVLGQGASDKIAFYGGTAQVQGTIDAAAAATTVSISTGTQWAYASSTQANAIVTLVNELRAELVAIGLCA